MSGRRPGSVFGLPALIGAFSLAALVLGLLGDGWHDVLAWAGLAVPLAAIAIAWAMRA